MKYIIIFFIITSTLYFCKSKENSINLKKIINTDMKIIYLYNVDEEQLNNDFIIKIIDDNKISGKICNNFNGNITFLKNNYIKIDNILSTKMLCPKISDIEYKVFEYLKKSNKMITQENKVMLYDEDNLLIELIQNENK